MTEKNVPNIIDEEIAPHLHSLILEEYHYLSLANSATAKRLFIEESTIVFGYPKTESLSIEVNREELKKTFDTIDHSAMPQAAKTLYYAKCEEQSDILNLLEAVKKSDDRAFHEASKAVYGEPDEILYRFTLDTINKRFRSLISKIDKKRKTLHRAYAVWKEFYEAQRKPSQISLFKVPNYEGIYVDDDDEIDSDEKIASMFTRYLENSNILNWSVVIDLPGIRTAFGVDQTTKTIHIPHNSDLQLRKTTLTKRYLKGLLAHEIGTHVVRRENGEQSNFALLAIGLAHYIRGEEGIATFAEQLITGTESYIGEIGYLAIGAAMGTLDRPLIFDEVLNILNAYYILQIANEELEENGFYDLQELQIEAFNSAWSRTTRTFRGTSGKTPGAVYTRDIVYLEGNRNIWKLAEEEPFVKDAWLIGKYNPADQSHVTQLQELGVIE